MWVRVFSLEEAEALLPQVKDLAAETASIHADLVETAAHRDDLRIVWGDAVTDPDCEGNEEFLRHSARCEALADEVAVRAARFRELGVELKDPGIGLVDFFSLNGDRLVYLCWCLGEDGITAWHTLGGGFQGRRPLPDLVGANPHR